MAIQLIYKSLTRCYVLRHTMVLISKGKTPAEEVGDIGHTDTEHSDRATYVS